MHAEERERVRSEGQDALKRHAQKCVATGVGEMPRTGHAVLLAQRATATCCRQCLSKWHLVPMGRTLEAREKDYMVRVILHWIAAQLQCTDDYGEGG